MGVFDIVKSLTRDLFRLQQFALKLDASTYDFRRINIACECIIKVVEQIHSHGYASTMSGHIRKAKQIRNEVYKDFLLQATLFDTRMRIEIITDPLYREIYGDTYQLIQSVNQNVLALESKAVALCIGVSAFRHLVAVTNTPVDMSLIDMNLTKVLNDAEKATSLLQGAIKSLRSFYYCNARYQAQDAKRLCYVIETNYQSIKKELLQFLERISEYPLCNRASNLMQELKTALAFNVNTPLVSSPLKRRRCQL